MNSKIICLLNVLCFVSLAGCSIITDSSDLMTGTKKQDDPISVSDSSTFDSVLDTGKGIFASDVEGDQKKENPYTGVDAAMVDSTGVDAAMVDSTGVDAAMVDSSAGRIDLDAGSDASALDVKDASDYGTNDSGKSSTNALCVQNCPDLDWVTIEGGSFMMGSAEGTGNDDEHLRHEVNVRSFMMSETEVTVAQYSLCVDEDICSEPDANYESDNWGKADRENHPVNVVDWYQAREFAGWIGGRLPSEAEWEYAARSGGLDNLYPWGNEDATCEHAVIDREASYNECGNDTTAEVRSKPLGNTVQGLCDMAGNVMEWVEDDWHDSYIGAPSNGQAWIDDPRDEYRVLRGGSWINNPFYCRSAYRYWGHPDRRFDGVGFRVVLDLK